MKPTPKEKAEELVEKFSNVHISTVPVLQSEAKEMALKCVDEINTQAKNWGIVSVKRYWQEVKQEIEKL